MIASAEADIADQPALGSDVAVLNTAVLESAGLDDGALHMAIVLGTLASGMLDVDDSSVEIADATSYEDYGVELFDDISFLDLELAAEEPFVPQWETHIVESGETFAVLAQNELGLGYSEVMALLEDLPDQRMLTNWRAGHSFDYQLDEDGRLLSLRMMKTPAMAYCWKRMPIATPSPLLNARVNPFSASMRVALAVVLHAPPRRQV